MANIFSFPTGSIAGGLLIGIFCIVLFFVLIKGWWKDANLGCLSYMIGFVLGIILIYQSILICGSIAIINAADYCEPALTEIVSKCTNNVDMMVTSEQSDEVLKEFTAKNAIMASLLGDTYFENCKASELPHTIIAKLKSNMRWFIFRRILWSVVLTVVAAMAVIKTMSRQFVQHDRTRQRIARTDRIRISRRRW